MSSRPLRSGSKNKFLRTFTYFIPAPPNRKNGYREKEFDKIMNGIIQSGFEVLDLQVQNAGGEHGGLFVVALLKAANAKTAKLDEAFDIQERFKLSHTHSSPDIILEDEDA